VATEGGLNPTLRLAIIDDHAIFRAGLRKLLESEPGFEVVAEGASGKHLVGIVQRHQPDLVLLDLAMPGSDGLDALREAGRAGLSPRTVMLTAEIDATEIVTALRLGTRGILMKTAATDLLFRCIETVMAGQFWVNRGTVQDLVSAVQHFERELTASRRAPYLLTPRERQILAALARGESNKLIARSLGIAEQTVKNHLSHLYGKFNVTSRLELVVLAGEQGLLPEASDRAAI